VLTLIGPLVNKLVTRRFVRNNVDIPWKADNTKIRQDLKMTFRPMQTTMEDAFQALIDAGVLP
jgi:hypothetical protein